ALNEPRSGAFDDDAELFGEFARERFAWQLAGLDLATRELPVTRIRLAEGALREQHAAVGCDDDRRSDRGERVVHVGRVLLRSPGAPAYPFATGQATRPLREPRCSANCSASRFRLSASRAALGAATPNAASHDVAAAR